MVRGRPKSAPFLIRRVCHVLRVHIQQFSGRHQMQHVSLVRLEPIPVKLERHLLRIAFYVLPATFLQPSEQRQLAHVSLVRPGIGHPRRVLRRIKHVSPVHWERFRLRLDQIQT